MIHSPRILVLDEPFESVDPVSSANLKDILIEYAKTGGTVMYLFARDGIGRKDVHACGRNYNNGLVCAAGTVDEVAAGEELEDPLPATGRRPPRSRPSRMARRRASPSPNFGPAGPAHSAYNRHARHTHR